MEPRMRRCRVDLGVGLTASMRAQERSVRNVVQGRARLPGFPVKRPPSIHTSLLACAAAARHAPRPRPHATCKAGFHVKRIGDARQGVCHCLARNRRHQLPTASGPTQPHDSRMRAGLQERTSSRSTRGSGCPSMAQRVSRETGNPPCGVHAPRALARHCVNWRLLDGLSRNGCFT